MTRLTVKELKQLLENVPDESAVYIRVPLPFTPPDAPADFSVLCAEGVDFFFGGPRGQQATFIRGVA